MRGILISTVTQAYMSRVLMRHQNMGFSYKAR